MHLRWCRQVASDQEWGTRLRGRRGSKSAANGGALMWQASDRDMIAAGDWQSQKRGRNCRSDGCKGARAVMTVPLRRVRFMRLTCLVEPHGGAAFARANRYFDGSACDDRHPARRNGSARHKCQRHKAKHQGRAKVKKATNGLHSQTLLQRRAWVNRLA